MGSKEKEEKEEKEQKEKNNSTIVLNILNHHLKKGDELNINRFMRRSFRLWMFETIQYLFLFEEEKEMELLIFGLILYCISYFTRGEEIFVSNLLLIQSKIMKKMLEKCYNSEMEDIYQQYKSIEWEFFQPLGEKKIIQLSRNINRVFIKINNNNNNNNNNERKYLSVNYSDNMEKNEMSFFFRS